MTALEDDEEGVVAAEVAEVAELREATDSDVAGAGGEGGGLETFGPGVPVGTDEVTGAGCETAVGVEPPLVRQD
jgi:hypothetical protein